MIPTKQMLNTTRPTTILVDNLLWDYTGFSGYVLTTEHYDTSGN